MNTKGIFKRYHKIIRCVCVCVLLCACWCVHQCVSVETKISQYYVRTSVSEIKNYEVNQHKPILNSQQVGLCKHCSPISNWFDWIFTWKINVAFITKWFCSIENRKEANSFTHWKILVITIYLVLYSLISKLLLYWFKNYYTIV